MGVGWLPRFYAVSAVSWWLFAVLILAPDLSMLGYLAGPRVGAFTSRIAHPDCPALLALAGSIFGNVMTTAIALIWIIHIAIDRAWATA